MEKCRKVLTCVSYLFRSHQLSTLSLPYRFTRNCNLVTLTHPKSYMTTLPPANSEFTQPLPAEENQTSTELEASDVPEGSAEKPKSNPVEAKKKSLLEEHLPPIDIDMDAESDASENEFNLGYESEDEDEKRKGEYHSKGISVYIPEKCMTPGTKRPRLKELPKDMFDDIRVIFFKDHQTYD